MYVLSLLTFTGYPATRPPVRCEGPRQRKVTEANLGSRELQAVVHLAYREDTMASAEAIAIIHRVRGQLGRVGVWLDEPHLAIRIVA